MKLIAIVVSVLMISLSVPNVSLWNFGIGIVNADDVLGSTLCNLQNNNKAGCLQSGSAYDIFVCHNPTWTPSTVPGETGLDSVTSCNSKCSADYGSNCLTSSAAPGGSSSAALILNPNSPVANQQFNIRFQFASQIPQNSRLEFDLDTTRSISCGVSSCAQTITVSVAGTYAVSARLISGSSITPLLLDRSEVIVTPATGGTGGTRQCCVLRSGDTFTYMADKDQTTCQAEGGFFYSDVCQNADRIVCQGFCQGRDPPLSGGSCSQFYGNPYNSNNYNNQFQGVCDQGRTCTCGPINTQQQRANEACSNFCLTDTQYSGLYSPGYTQTALRFPIPQCTNNPQLFLSSFQIAGAAAGTTTGIQGGVERWWCGQQGQNQCAADEKCCCVLTRVNTVTTSNPTVPATIPGTSGTPRWNPTDALENPPTSAPNERRCDLAVNATITASFGSAEMQQSGGQATTGLRLVQAGDTITITGKVTKLSDQCGGYQYTCRAQREVNCNVDSGFFSTKLEYKSCPADIPDRIHEEGEKSVTNWRRIGALVGTAAGIAAMIATGGTTAALLAGPTASMAGQVATSGCDASQVDVLVSSALQLSVQQAFRTTQNNPGSTNPTGQPLQYVTSAQCSSYGGNCISQGECSYVGGVDFGTCEGGVNVCCGTSPAQTGAVTADPTFKVNGESVVTGNSVTGDSSAVSGAGAGGGFSYASLAAIAPALNSLFPNCPSVEDVVACFSVCGKEYTSRTSYAPTCERGGPVIGAEEADYFCGLGDCGGFAGKRVTVKIYAPDGSLAIDDSVTAGADGEFSYTFNSPVGDGDFTVIVAAPKE